MTLFLVACGATPKVRTTNVIAEKNKDVFILSNLIQEHLKRTKGRDLNLSELLQKDTLGRITNNFERVELKQRAGYILVYYQLSELRNNKIELNNKERELLHLKRWRTKDLAEQYDGEIRFEYGERGYNVNTIIVRKE